MTNKFSFNKKELLLKLDILVNVKTFYFLLLPVRKPFQCANFPSRFTQNSSEVKCADLKV
ncbi:CLUMA_CG011668, isoform A [Clunio marinus]|uniref:CLUMA_CG011668, isoform A n=1 Tax=Clunio marinus TaxID=568069 RepID=A0A1J1IEW3_9DIPT|nr:CLUMA_CG011668, isoform A [Clunio marinus]